MTLPHRIIGHIDIHIVDYEAKTYVNSFDYLCQPALSADRCGSKSLFGANSKLNLQI
jgi:hypothetical protein